MLGGLRPSVKALGSSIGSGFPRLSIKYSIVETQTGLLFLSRCLLWNHSSAEDWDFSAGSCFSLGFLGKEGLQSCKTCCGAQSSFGMLAMGQEDNFFELPIFLEGLPMSAFHLKYCLVAIGFGFF